MAGRDSSEVLFDHRAPRAGRAARLRGALLVSAIAALLVLPPLGRQTITTSDEARFPLLARDMIERGAWFDVHVREKQYRNKPPLYPWSIATLSLLSGRVTEATAQLPVALAAIGAALFTFLLGDRLFNARTGLWAGVILATSYGFFQHSQKILPDMLVVCFAAAAGYAFWRATLQRPSRWALVFFYAALAFGVFAKGPVGLLPLLAAAVWLWTEERWSGLKRLWNPLGVMIFGIVTGSWLGPFLVLGTESFAKTVLWRNWLDWYLGVPAPEQLALVVLNGLFGFMPWTLVALLAVVSAARAWRNPAVRFALLWFAVPLAVILPAESQRARYLLSIYPGAALLVAWWIDAYGTVSGPAKRVIAWGALACSMAGIGTLVAADWFRTSQHYFIPRLSWEAVPLMGAMAVMGIALCWGLWRGRPTLLVSGVVGAMVVILGYGTQLHIGWVNERQDFRGLAARVGRHALNTDARVFGGRFFQIDFYLGRPLLRIRTLEEFNEYVARPDRPVVVLPGRVWGLIQGRISPHIAVVDRMQVRGQNMLIVRVSEPGSDGPGRQ